MAYKGIFDEKDTLLSEKLGLNGKEWRTRIRGQGLWIRRVSLLKIAL